MVQAAPTNRSLSGGRVLLGPLLTSTQLAGRIDATGSWLRRQPYLLRIEGALSAGPAYPLFLVKGDALRLDLSFLGLVLRRRVTDLEACDWLVRRREDLGGLSPLQSLDGGGSVEGLLEKLPEPTKPQPAGEGRTGLAEIRRAWLDLGSEPGQDRVSVWARISAGSDAVPLGI